MRDHNHNLIQQLSESLDSLWRCKQYRKDVGKRCATCHKLWGVLETRFTGIEKLLRKELERHVHHNIFD